MKNKIEKIIANLSIEFNKVFEDFQGIYLYGIFKDFQPHDDEDIELVAVFDAEDKSKRELIWKIIGKTENDFDVFIDLHPIPLKELEKDEAFFQEVVIEGLFYNKSGVKK